MCDSHTNEDTIEYQLRSGLSRRDFGALTLGAGLTSMLIPVARGDELPVSESDVDIKTPDGTADAYFVHPSKGAHPAVLMWPDIFGLRPAFRQMAKRLAASGYSVLVVNPYYRKQRAPVAPEHAEITTRNGEFTLAPLGAPVSVENVQIDRRHLLAEGETITLGSGYYVFKSATAGNLISKSSAGRVSSGRRLTRPRKAV